jgi:hypothetical protein
MQDRPTIAELLDAIRGFLEKDAIDALDGTAKFHARVSANVLAIAERELELEATHLAAEWERLNGLLGPLPAPADQALLRAQLAARTEELCERIRRGDADAGPFRAAVLAHVATTVREKLAITNPKLLAAESTTR